MKNENFDIEELLKFLQNANSREDMAVAKLAISQIYLRIAANLFGKIEEAVKK